MRPWLKVRGRNLKRTRSMKHQCFLLKKAWMRGCYIIYYNNHIQRRLKYSTKDIKWKCQQHRSIEHCSCWRSDYCDKRTRGFWYCNINLRSRGRAYRCRIINVRNEEWSCHKQYKQIYSRNFGRKKMILYEMKRENMVKKMKIHMYMMKLKPPLL